ncbi:Clavaminate synthase-like protein [Lindgomyces ingoldianus]|uniref:Clavaminate synthase-like protein n=1 Tax=Lindgomyces ingoldianus TaxID=673940 RepID=A0ACB6R1F1_9PLEO|nr:Clavaminate synthase-like protein [Lindgomyces ingoldianus]KAF2472160.1 Clavaminate synthase-like protein [Lindgomyces ingoldianus]
MPLRPQFRLFIPQHRCHSHWKQRFVPVKVLDNITPKIDLAEPAILPGRFRSIPAISKWFTPYPSKKGDSGFHELNVSYLTQHGDTIVPLELTQVSSSPSNDLQISSFERFEAPLSLLLSYIKSTQDSSTNLYLAQCSLDNLPVDLQADLPTPSLISVMGRGDIYGSSLWLGQPPTRTPLHRDPNPNVFVQLAGKKVIRLMKPDAGNWLYERLRVGDGHANMRGDEMMVGTEMERLEAAVWRDEGVVDKYVKGWEAELGSGDLLYIPLGWWHAVRGIGKGINGSANWWFR